MRNTKAKVLALLTITSILSGCGSIFGVREFEVWHGGPKWQFSEGTDFHVGANSIDRVDDHRGVSRLKDTDEVRKY